MDRLLSRRQVEELTGLPRFSLDLKISQNQVVSQFEFVVPYFFPLFSIAS